MTIAEQARVIRAMVGHLMAGRIVDLIELRAALLARYPRSAAAKVLAGIIAHRTREKAGQN